jgi:hypothetical protein
MTSLMRNRQWRLVNTIIMALTARSSTSPQTMMKATKAARTVVFSAIRIPQVDPLMLLRARARLP